MVKKTKVYVGMSGGVDSSLSAALLVEQGYDVTGVYMKNWTMDLPGVKCPWADDLADAKRVAVQLGIDFKVFDFQKEYKQKVVDYMIDEYKKGRTPNPDIMCNQEVKFKLFLDAALEDGADLIATGHYARVSNSETEMSASVSKEHLQPEFSKAPGPLMDAARSRSEEIGAGSSVHGYKGVLLRAVDDNKDQTYFLYRVTGEAMAKTLFPIGEFTKPQVRKMAAERGLTTAIKKDSQGICFVGQVGIRDFLSMYVKQQSGKIIESKSKKVLGHHDGAIFYTLGQRHGLELGGGLPYYVVGKDMDKNEVYVTTDLNNDNLWSDEIHLDEVHWINQAPADGEYQIRIRHRAPLIKAFLKVSDNSAVLRFDNPERATANGQSVVIYDNEVCLGGGVVN